MDLPWFLAPTKEETPASSGTLPSTSKRPSPFQNELNSGHAAKRVVGPETWSRNEEAGSSWTWLPQASGVQSQFHFEGGLTGDPAIWLSDKTESLEGAFTPGSDEPILDHHDPMLLITEPDSWHLQQRATWSQHEKASSSWTRIPQTPDVQPQFHFEDGFTGNPTNWLSDKAKYFV